MITEKELKECELVHDHGGIGWVMVENLDKDYCRVSGMSDKEVGTQAFLAWKKKLKPMKYPVDKLNPNAPTGPILLKHKPAKALDALTAMRNALLSGSKKVVQTHIVNA